MHRKTTPLMLVCAGLIAGALIVRGIYGPKPDTSANAQAYFEKADHLQETGHPREAIAAMQKAVAADPKFYGARRGLADLYDSERREPEAIAVLEEGKSLVPRDRVLYASALSELYRSMGDYARAIQNLRESLEAPPVDAFNRMELERELPQLLESAKQWDAAEQAWKDLAAHYPDNHSARDSADRGLKRIRHMRAEEGRKEQGHSPAKPAGGKSTP